MKIVVVDSSVIVKWLNQTNEQYIESADKIITDALEGSIDIIAPELAKYEIGNVLLFSKKLTESEANVSLSTLYSLPITFITESFDLTKQTYHLSTEWGITYYDAAFLALAKQYNAVLITDNIKHQGKTKAIQVIPLKEYR